MSSLFSIGEEELDLDDEDCLLAACGIGCSTDGTEGSPKRNSDSGLNQSSSIRQFLRTKEVEKLRNSYERRPFESLSNICKSDRIYDLKTSSEQIHKSSAFINFQNNSTTFQTATNELNVPVAKRFATDDPAHKSLPTKRSVLCSSSVAKATDHSPLKAHSDGRFSPVQRNSFTGDPKIEQKLSKSSSRVHTLNITSPSCRTDPTFSSTPSLRKELSVFHKASSNSKALNSTIRTANVTVSQKKKLLTEAHVVGIPPGDLSKSSRNTAATFCDERERQNTANTFQVDNNKVENRDLQLRTPRTPQACQAVTPCRSKTPISRKFPGPAGLLPKLSPGQNFDDASFTSPLPTAKKPSPVQSKVSQIATSDDEDFNRDPWTCMYQEFLTNVPVAMRYTIIRALSEAIQQTLDHGKVPCLCALVKAFSLKEADASVLLKDPTGEIHGTLHHKVLEDYQADLAPGAGLILKHVSVFSPAPRKHYLNITPGNILQIYPPDPRNITSSQSLASQCTQMERRQKEHRQVNERIVTGECVDRTEQKNILTERSTEEDSWGQNDCFEDLLEGLDDDEDLLDEALLL